MGLNPHIIPCSGSSANSMATANTSLKTAIDAAVIVAQAVPKVLLNQITIVYGSAFYDGTNYQATGAVTYNVGT